MLAARSQHGTLVTRRPIELVHQGKRMRGRRRRGDRGPAQRPNGRRGDRRRRLPDRRHRQRADPPGLTRRHDHDRGRHDAGSLGRHRPGERGPAQRPQRRRPDRRWRLPDRRRGVQPSDPPRRRRSAKLEGRSGRAGASGRAGTTYKLTLTVTSADGQEATDTAKLKVKKKRQPPGTRWRARIRSAPSGVADGPSGSGSAPTGSFIVSASGLDETLGKVERAAIAQPARGSRLASIINMLLASAR